MKIGDFVISMGKPGVVKSIFTSEDGNKSYISLVSPDLIARNSNAESGELVDIGNHVVPCDKEVVLKTVDDYVKMLENRIAKLKEFGETIKGENNGS